ncbi:MAG: hypothetical protein AABW67_01590 [Nanoarchaeota archaeon]
MEITKEFKNNMLKRTEISLTLESVKNPNFDEMKKDIAKHFKKSEESVDVRNIYGSFGSSEFVIDAYVYDSAEDLKKAEQKTQKQREAEKKLIEDAKKSKEEKKKADEEAKKASSEASE